MKEIEKKIETLLYEKAPDFEISQVLKADIKTYFGTLEESFAKSSGKGFLLKHTRKVDSIIQMVYKVAMRSMFSTYMPMKNTLPLTLLALGSYGREQLCVYSDIDLMIVYEDIPGYNIKEMIEKILYILWDAGLKLGHRVHEVRELFDVSQTDITIKTSMIESRFIEGSKQLWDKTQNELYRIRKDNQEDFIIAKIEEMQKLHDKYPMTMEPHLKEGVGGFRNANLVYWIGNIRYNISKISDLESSIISEKEYKAFWKALEFLFKVRSALHLATGKKEDKLRLELIPSVAVYLGYSNSYKDQMNFSRKVISNLKIIKLYSTIWIEELSHYLEKKGKLTPPIGNFNYYSLIERLTQALPNQFPVHPSYLQALNCSHREANVDESIYGILIKVLLHPQSHLIFTTLIDCRLLGYTIPYIKKVINLPQFDGYHQYAVGIHSVMCVQALENIKDSKIQLLYENLNVEERIMIKAVTLLHDAGKGRKKSHHEVGTVLFKGFGRRLHLPKELIKIGKNLILYHTLMSTTAQGEDLYSERVILKFSSHFPTQKELDLIYILTYADMNGVGSNIYNDFNAGLIHTLYTQASLVLSNGELLHETSRRVKKEKQLQQMDEFKQLPKTLQKKVINIDSDLFFLKNSTKRIINIVQKANTLKNYTSLVSNSNFLTIEILRKDNLDLSFLLHKLSRLEIVQMDIYKLFMGIKYFRIDFNTTIPDDDLIDLEEILYQSLTSIHSLNLKKPVIKESELEINCNHSKEYARMKFNCKNQKELLSFVINVLDKFKIDIVSAKIHTKMNRINDLFLIEKNGNFCNNTSEIIKELTER